MRSNERGEGKFGVIIFIAVVAIIIFVAVKYVPPRLNAYEFKEYVEQTAIQAPYDPKATNDSIRRNLFEKAQELNIPITEEEITVTKTGEACNISVIVRIPIDFKVKQHVLELDCSTKSRSV
jgi:hypothetical protein